MSTESVEKRKLGREDRRLLKPMRKIHVMYRDPDATDSSSDEDTKFCDRIASRKKSVQVVKEIVIPFTRHGSCEEISPCLANNSQKWATGVSDVPYHIYDFTYEDIHAIVKITSTKLLL